MKLLREKICCLELFNILEDGILDERVSGIFLQKKNSGCVGEIPRIRFCPMCGSKFKVTKTNSSWDWEVDRG